MMNTLPVMRLTDSALLPKRATVGSAGYDLFADISEERSILPHHTVKIGTGIAIDLSTESGLVVGLIYARSGLATKFGIAPANCVGVIDSDYRGEIIVALHNFGETEYTVKPHERIAQLVIAPVFTPEIVEQSSLTDTIRSDGGFGSTGS